MTIKKIISSITVIFVAFAMMFTLSACMGNTLEKYSKKNPEFSKKLASRLDSNGIDGKTSISGNTINVDIDVSKMLDGTKLTNNLKASLDDSFKQSFIYQTDDFVETIRSIQKETDCSNVKLKIKVMNGNSEIGTYEFDENSRSPRTSEDAVNAAKKDEQ